MVYTISRIIVHALHSPWIRKVEGVGNIPKEREFIVAANHSSYFDVLFLPSIIIKKTSKRMHALVSSHYWNSPFTRFFLNLWQCIPVFVEKEKNSIKKNKLALEMALNYIQNGHILMIFPEGKRSPDGKLQKAYTGIAKLALKSRVPVLPCGIIGADKVLPKGAAFPRFARCDIKIGKPIYFNRYFNKKISNKILEEVTRTIMKEIARLIGQKYSY